MRRFISRLEFHFRSGSDSSPHRLAIYHPLVYLDFPINFFSNLLSYLSLVHLSVRCLPPTDLIIDPPVTLRLCGDLFLGSSSTLGPVQISHGSGWLFTTHWFTWFYLEFPINFVSSSSSPIYSPISLSVRC